MVNILRKIFGKSNKIGSYPSVFSVKKESNRVFDKYQKTFKDLAQYDKTGKIS